MSNLPAHALVGMSNTRERVENDYYATPFSTTKLMLDKEKLDGSILEPACGEGHISKVLKEYYPNNEIISMDLIDRDDLFNVGIVPNIDFIKHDFKTKFDNVVTNPPFKLIQEFIEKALEITNKKVIMFAKIQLLEGVRRKDMFANTPLKHIYVFSERQSPWRNGEEFDENGKKWSSTMCFAWFVWEHGYEGSPTLSWI